MSANPTTPSKVDTEPIWHTVVDFTLPATAERTEQAVQQVMTAVKDLQLSSARLEQLEAALVEALHNALSQNHRLRPRLPLQICSALFALGKRPPAYAFFTILFRHVMLISGFGE